MYETAYRAVWVTRPRLGVTVSGSPSRSSCRLRRPIAFAFGSSSRALRHSYRVSRATTGPDLTSELPSLGFRPSSRRHLAESTGGGIPGRHRSVLDVSHVLDGFLLHETLQVCFTPQPRPGFTLQGFPPVRSRTGSSPAVALVSLRELPTPSLTQVLREFAPAFRALLRSPVRRSTQRFRPRATPSPLELPTPSGFPSHTVGATFTAPSDHGLSRPSSCCQYATWLALASLPSPSEIPGLQLRADLRRHFATRPQIGRAHV